jgi:glyoxylase-like metal-dependent hydrolase (beta-lactamase superfamily II)
VKDENFIPGVFMQEIAPDIFIETNYPGVTLGAISYRHGLLLIDAPFRAEDTRSWRSALANLGGGVDRLLVNMDAHFDRTLGSRAMECTIVAHEKVSQIFRNRPVTFKTQGAETGAEWEQHNGLGSIRWAPPEITFTDAIQIHWDDKLLNLVSRPGCSPGAIWAELPSDKVVFVGDTLVKDQPPFLAACDLPAWIGTLRLLLSPAYQNWTVVAGRGGLAVHEEIRFLLSFLENLHTQLEGLAGRAAPTDEVDRLVPLLVKEFRHPGGRAPFFRQRLAWGLRQCYIRHYRAPGGESLDAE